MKKIITYNVNGIRSAISKGLFDWLVAASPDILCLQETKAQPDQIPTLDFEALGYQTYWFSAKKKGYSGTGLLTKVQPDRVVLGMDMPQYDDEGRLIRADYGEISVISVYHPSGSSGEERQAFKMKWLDDFYNYLQQLRKERPYLIISGDYNICHKPIDIHDPISNAKSSGFLPEEREWMSKFIDSGFVDTFRFFNQQPHQYTWWSFRANARARNLGWRIDYHMASENLKDRLRGVQILPQATHSDHCPAVVQIDF
ncbi:MAG: exodeoxyribonuclease III [Bacteroidales bacterium]|nr:exodeoxyribonuclease III [Bacteroidales bacterium]MDZ4205262.1 exodeoxyribonuclease III [Bacteroidales bacterium]